MMYLFIAVWLGVIALLIGGFGFVLAPAYFNVFQWFVFIGGGLIGVSIIVLATVLIILFRKEKDARDKKH